MNAVVSLALLLGSACANSVQSGSAMQITEFKDGSCGEVDKVWRSFYVYSVDNGAACLFVVNDDYFNNLAKGSGDAAPTPMEVIMVSMSNTHHVSTYAPGAAGISPSCTSQPVTGPMYHGEYSDILNGLNDKLVTDCYQYQGSNPSYQGRSFKVLHTFGATTPNWFFNIQSLLPDGATCQSNNQCASNACHGQYGDACNSNDKDSGNGRQLFGAQPSNNQPDCFKCMPSQQNRRQMKGRALIKGLRSKAKGGGAANYKQG